MWIKSKHYLAIVCLLLYLFSASAFAEEDRTNLGLIESIKSINLSTEIYSDAANIKSLAILFLSAQEGKVRDADNNKFANSVINFLNGFNAIFKAAKNSQPEYHKEGVRKAIELREEALYLESLSRSSGKELLARIVDNEKASLNRFLREQADYFENLAEKEIAIPLKIDYLEYAEMAYREVGDVKYEIVKKKHDDMKSNFDMDMEQAQGFSREADEIINLLREEKESGLFSSYAKSKDAIEKYSDALEIYHRNGISEETLEKLTKNYIEIYNELKRKIGEAKDISSSIFEDLVTFLLKILIPLFLISIIFVLGFRDWKKDFTDTSLNKMLRRE